MALRKSDRDLAELAVLALLLSGSRYRYEMHRLMIRTHNGFVNGLPRSLYHAVDGCWARSSSASWVPTGGVVVPSTPF